MPCRTGCPTQDHASWGECARAADIHTQWLGGTGVSFGDQKRFAKTNSDFRQAVKDGLNPSAVSDQAIRTAYESAERG